MPLLFCIFCWLYFGANDAANKCLFFLLKYGIWEQPWLLLFLSSFHSHLICIWSEASTYVMANTRSFMILLFQVYWIDAIGIWSDTNHYINIVLYVILSKLRHLAYVMMTYFSEPTIQSYFLHLTANWKKCCCPGFMFFFNCVILCSYPPKKTCFWYLVM